jgi:Putative transposase/Transposase zinc-binding domain
MLRPGSEIRYRIVPILERHWEAFFQSKRGWIRPVVLETVRKLLACRTPALGCHVYQCPSCERIEVVPHSCKSRFCPTCGKHATDRWADEVLNDLLEVPYHHLVLSTPWQLRPILLFNRAVGLSLLARAASATFNQWAADQHGMRVGVITVIHTFGADLKWHPHLHLLVTEGGLSLDGERWVEPYKLGWLMAEAGLKKMWRYHVITAFRTAHREGKLRFPADSAFMKQYPCFNSLLQKLYDLTWYVHIGACLLDPTASLRYIGRYTKRAVLAEYRITSYDGKKVRFAFKDYAQGGKTSFKTLKVLAFIGRLIRHVPDKHFKMVRYSGLFAPRWQARHLEQARRALGESAAESVRPTEETAVSLLNWHERQRAQGRDPLRCQVCSQALQLVEIAFGPHKHVARLFERAGRPVRAFHPAAAMGP